MASTRLRRVVGGALLAVALAACASDPPTAPAAPGAAPAMNCGERIEAVVSGSSPLASLAASFPPSVRRDGDATFSGTVTLSAVQALTGVASPAADVLVVSAGRVVALPPPKDAVGMAVDLPAGGVQELGAVGTIVDCGAGAPLAAGRYELYAVVAVTGDSGPGSETIAVGGPWPLEVV